MAYLDLMNVQRQAAWQRDYEWYRQQALARGLGSLGQASLYGGPRSHIQIPSGQFLDIVKTPPKPKTLRTELQAETDEWLKDAV